MKPFQMANEYRADLNATTMLGQAKTVIQGRIYQSSLSGLNSDKAIFINNMTKSKTK